ncbi:MAG: hydrolase, partial [Candidatus Bathyarchaeales archaeon]
MPFTPFHLGPVLLFGLALSTVLDLSTLLIASVIPDVEPFCVLLFDL